MSEEVWTFNGIDATTGDYLLRVTPEIVRAVASGESVDEGLRAELEHRCFLLRNKHLGVKEGVDVGKLAESGWGVVFPWAVDGSPEAMEQAAILERLRPLLDLRKRQATVDHAHRYREYVGVAGVRPNESKNDFLARHHVGPGPVDPDRFPYYLLIVADPRAISFQFQSQLGVSYAVGRLWFPTLDEYANYARSVVEAETRATTLARRLTFFGVQNEDDLATRTSSEQLIPPLVGTLTSDVKAPNWTVERLPSETSTRQALSDLLHGDAPALLFTASHGMGFPPGDERQLAHQGALLCQDWPGPSWRGRIPEEFYFSGDQLRSDANLHGTIAFMFACFGAGTPERDEFSRHRLDGQPRAPAAIAPHPFLARLPTAMLGRERGGALAVIGHVERAWGHSFLWKGADGKTFSQTAVFESALRSLMCGKPVGAAMEAFDNRYGELSTMITEILKYEANGHRPFPELPYLWTANNDARGYAVLGDPAVRVMVGDGAPTGRRQRATVAVSTITPVTEAAVGTNPVSAAGLTEAADGAAPSGSAEDVSFGLKWRRDEPAGAVSADGTAGTLRGFVAKFGAMISSALDDMSKLEVTTCTTDDMKSFYFEGKTVIGVRQRAYTRVSLDGDTVIIVPERDGEIDRELLALHQETVKQAQETRAELMKTIVQAATSLIRLTS